MSQVLYTKAMMLGISEEDIEAMTKTQLEREVKYASLSSAGRNNLERGQVSMCLVSRTSLPEPMVVQRRVA